MTLLTKQICKRLGQVLARHPVAWLLAGTALFWMWGGLIPRIRWNAIEMMMAKNLLAGNGLIVAPLDPPALWRPLLGALVCASVELFTTSPRLVYQIVYAVSLTVFLVASFYAARALWDAAAGHVACLFILTSGALTSRLVNHVDSISHVVFLLAAGPALLFTVLAMREPTGRRLLGAGIAWGLAYLARWESMLFFGIAAGALLCAIYTEQRHFTALRRGSFAVLGFAALYVPATTYAIWAKSRFGIWGPSAITTFYASEAWVTGTGDEMAGTAVAERKYGSLEANRFNVLRAIASNPGAFGARLRINVPKVLRLYMDRQFFDPVWLLLLLGLACGAGWSRTRLLSVGMLLMIFLSSTIVILCFHIDYRYLIAGLPSLLLILCGGVSSFGNRVKQVFGGGKAAVSAACLLLLAWRTAGTSYGQLVAARNNPDRSAGIHIVEFARDLARHFRQAVHPERPIALLVLPSRGSEMNTTDMFLVSYFAGTALASRPPALYPRDLIFSIRRREPDYVYATAESLHRTDLPLPGPPVAAYRANTGDVYYLFKR
ncbi:MAG: hypothetical protein ABSG65_17080 [Bryobacteraceae bacterium]|jgi:hypothetical protein